MAETESMTGIKEWHKMRSEMEAGLDTTGP